MVGHAGVLDADPVVFSGQRIVYKPPFPRVLTAFPVRLCGGRGWMGRCPCFVVFFLFFVNEVVPLVEPSLSGRE